MGVIFMYKVAICDDQKIMRIMIKTQLKRYSEEYSCEFDITEFESGDELIAAFLAGNECDIIISDINMPGTDGIDTVKEIRKNCEKTIPVIFQSSLFDSERLTLEFLPWQFIDKPVRWEKFSVAMTRCIEHVNE